MKMLEGRFDSPASLEESARAGNEGGNAKKRALSLDDVWAEVQQKTRQGLGWKAPVKEEA